MRPIFTPEERAEIARADEELEASSFHLTPEDLSRGRYWDRAAELESMDNARRKRAAYRKAYYEANRERLAPQRKIRDARKLRGMTQAALGKLIGVTQSTVANWETCMVPANWTALLEVMPELEGAV